MTAPVSPAPAASTEGTPSPVPSGAPENQPRTVPNIQDAINASRARLAEGQGLVDLPQGHPSQFQRREEGRFAPDDDLKLDEPPQGEPETPEAPAEEAPAEEAPPEQATDVAEDEIVVKLPGVRAEDPDIDIAVNDPATAETLNRLKNGYMRGEQMRDERAAMDKDREEREQFVDLVRTDPVGFVAANLPAESRAETALYLLTQPDIWPHVVDDIRALVENPNVLRIARAELETARFKIRDQMRAASDERATVRTEVRAIEGHLSALVPDTMEEVQSQVFVNDCRRDLATYARQTGAKSIDARLIPQILAPRLQAYGITMMDAAQRIARGAGAGAASRPTGIPSANGVKAPARSTVSAKKTPQELRAVHARKVNAATPAPGNVVPTSGGGDTELKGKNLADTFAVLRRRLAAGRGLTQ